jgi:hypothetical protein
MGNLTLPELSLTRWLIEDGSFTHEISSSPKPPPCKLPAKNSRESEGPCSQAWEKAGRPPAHSEAPSSTSRAGMQRGLQRGRER